MSTHTLQEAVHAFFGHEAIWTSQPVGEGYIHKTWRVEIPSLHRAFAVQQFNDAVFPHPEKVMGNILEVVTWLAVHDYPLRLPVPRTLPDGHTLFRDSEGKLWRAFPWFDHDSSAALLTGPEEAFEGARAYGTLMRTLDGLPPQRLHKDDIIPHFHDLGWRIGRLGKAITEADEQRLALARPWLDRIRPHFDLAEKLARTALPDRICHNDAKPSNLLWDASGRVVAIVDFDTVMPNPVWCDFGDMVRSFVSPVAEDEPDLE
ncbi:MAG: aminoglycoside phosphotransferase family protein, partial [Bacteroidetes bacterium]